MQAEANGFFGGVSGGLDPDSMRTQLAVPAGGTGRDGAVCRAGSGVVDFGGVRGLDAIRPERGRRNRAAGRVAP